jgi:hypothetical protein
VITEEMLADPAGEDHRTALAHDHPGRVTSISLVSVLGGRLLVGRCSVGSLPVMLAGPASGWHGK